MSEFNSIKFVNPLNRSLELGINACGEHFSKAADPIQQVMTKVFETPEFKKSYFGTHAREVSKSQGGVLTNTNVSWHIQSQENNRVQFIQENVEWFLETDLQKRFQKEIDQAMAFAANIAKECSHESSSNPSTPLLNEIKRKEASVSKEFRKLEKIKNKLKESEAKNKKLNDRLEKLEKGKSEAENTIKTLEETLELLQTKGLEDSNKIYELIDKANNLESEKQKIDQELLSLKDKLSLSEEQIAQVTTSYTRLELELSKVDKELQSEKDQVKQLQSAIAEKNQKYTTLNGELEKTKTELKRITELEKTNASLRSRLNENEVQNQNAINNLQERLRKASTELSQVQTREKATQEALENQKSETSQIIDELRAAHGTQVKELLQTIQSQQEELKNKTSALKEAAESLETLHHTQSKIASLEHELEQAKDSPKIRELVNDNLILKRQLAAAEVAAGKAQEELKATQQNMNLVQTLNRELVQRIDTIQDYIQTLPNFKASNLASESLEEIKKNLNALAPLTQSDIAVERLIENIKKTESLLNQSQEKEAEQKHKIGALQEEIKQKESKLKKSELELSDSQKRAQEREDKLQKEIQETSEQKELLTQEKKEQAEKAASLENEISTLKNELTDLNLKLSSTTEEYNEILDARAEENTSLIEENEDYKNALTKAAEKILKLQGNLRESREWAEHLEKERDEAANKLKQLKNAESELLSTSRNLEEEQYYNKELHQQVELETENVSKLENELKKAHAMIEEQKNAIDALTTESEQKRFDQERLYHDLVNQFEELTKVYLTLKNSQNKANEG